MSIRSCRAAGYPQEKHWAPGSMVARPPSVSSALLGVPGGSPSCLQNTHCGSSLQLTHASSSLTGCCLAALWGVSQGQPPKKQKGRGVGASWPVGTSGSTRLVLPHPVEASLRACGWFWGRCAGVWGGGGGGCSFVVTVKHLPDCHHCSFCPVASSLLPALTGFIIIPRLKPCAQPEVPTGPLS